MTVHKMRQHLKSEISRRYLKRIFLLTGATSLLYAFAAWSCLFYAVTDLYIFIVAVVIVALAAGALATLISVYPLYALFVLLSMVPLISILIFHGGEIFTLFAFILTIFTIATLTAGHRQYTLLKNSISLEETFQTIFEKSSDGIVLIQNNRFQDCNKAILKMFQYDSKEEILTTHLSNLMPKRQKDKSLSVKKMLQISKITYKNGHHNFEWTYATRNGDLFCADVHLTKIYLNGEKMLLGNWRDITERKKLEIEKEAAQQEIKLLNQNLESKIKLEVDKNREKDQVLLRQSRLAQMGEMISMIAHQWRQPLAAISATSAALELKATMNRLDNNDVQQKAHNISDYSQHLSKTIDDFRGFFKPNKEKMETSYEKIIDSVLLIMETSLKNKDIELIKNLNCHETFYTYPGEIKQVILNLIVNAEEALIETKPIKPYIEITSYTQNGEYTVEIRDNAGGIDEKYIDYIFDPYFSTKKSKDGTGLGLYMSKIIVEEHCHGTLSINTDNIGSVFSIRLPKSYGKKEYGHD